MGTSRKKALDGIENLVAQVESHLEKLDQDATNTAADHWRAESRSFLGRMRKMAQQVGRKTGEMWTPCILEWESRMEEIS